MKPFLLAGVFVVAVVAGYAPAPVPDKPKPDKERLQGVWVITAIAFDGKETLKEGDAFYRHLNSKLIFTDDKVIMSSEPDSDQTFTLDPDKKPPTLDILTEVTKTIRQTSRHLYEFKDDNTLRLCRSNNGKEYPKEFTAKGGQMLLTLKREEKKPEK